MRVGILGKVRYSTYYVGRKDIIFRILAGHVGSSFKAGSVNTNASLNDMTQGQDTFDFLN
jgi:hypothetical protein